VLYYRNKDEVMVVSVKTGPSLILRTPQVLFRGPYTNAGGTVGTSWDIHPDHKKFPMMKPAQGDASETLLPTRYQHHPELV